MNGTGKDYVIEVAQTLQDKHCMPSYKADFLMRASRGVSMWRPQGIRKRPMRGESRSFRSGEEGSKKHVIRKWKGMNLHRGTSGYKCLTGWDLVCIVGCLRSSEGGMNREGGLNLIKH